MQKQEHHPAEQEDVDQHPAQRAVQYFADEGFVAAGAAVEGAVEPAEEACSFMGFTATGLSSVAQRAGVRIMATSTERTIAATIVIENWR